MTNTTPAKRAQELRKAIYDDLPYPERTALMTKLIRDTLAPGGNLGGLLHGLHEFVTMTESGMGLHVLFRLCMEQSLEEGTPLAQNITAQRLAVNSSLPYDLVEDFIYADVTAIVMPMKSGQRRCFTMDQLDYIARSLPSDHAVTKFMSESIGLFTDGQVEAFVMRWAPNCAGATSGTSWGTASSSARSWNGEPQGDDRAFFTQIVQRELSEEALAVLWDTFPSCWWEMVAQRNLDDTRFQQAVEAVLGNPSPDRPAVKVPETLRQMVMRSPRLDPRLIHLLFQETDNWKHLARNPNLSVNAAEIMRGTDNREVLVALLDNDHLDPMVWNEVFEDFLKFNTPLDNCRAMLSPQISTVNLMRLYRTELAFNAQQMEWFYTSPAADEGFRLDVLKSAAKRNFGPDFVADMVRKYPEHLTDSLATAAKEHMSGNSWQVRTAREVLQKRGGQHAGE